MRIGAPTKEHIPALKKLWQEAFGDSESAIDTFFEAAFCTDRCVLATDNGQVLGALYWLECEYRERPVAYLYAIATAKAHRGKGVCHSIMEYTNKRLRELGYIGAVLVPGSKELFSFYEAMGYSTFSTVSEPKLNASQRSIELRKINATEYAEIRRELLPKNSVIQEKENLRYIEKEAELYTGNGFLLACYREKSILYGMELLGDASLAGDILFTLGCKEGSFRTVGEGRPFAMYLPLDRGYPSPEYFGLAFD